MDGRVFFFNRRKKKVNRNRLLEKGGGIQFATPSWDESTKW